MLFNKDYNKGFNDGLKHGAKQAKKAVAIEFVNRLQQLRNTKGIGPKTWDKILDCLDINKEESSMCEKKNKYVGREFKARKTYPFTTKGRQHQDTIADIKYGEKVRVESYDEETGLYKLLNLDTPPHYILVREETLIEINGQIS